MVTGQIKLGATKELSRNSQSRDQLEGFFYGGGVVLRLITITPATYQERQIGRSISQSRRQHLILQTICKWQSMARLRELLGKVSPLPEAQVNDADQFLPLAFHLFYDIPSKKRDAECTNILHTGATLSGVGEGQRLRKGFQRRLRGSAGVRSITASIGNSTYTLCLYGLIDKDAGWGILPVFESLSSAAELRHSARNTRL